MSQVQPIVEPELAPLSVLAARKRSRARVPGWLLLLLANPKSRFGLAVLAFMIFVAVIAPWVSVDHPTGRPSAEVTACLRDRE
jgi:hypothetical protein